MTMKLRCEAILGFQVTHKDLLHRLDSGNDRYPLRFALPDQTKKDLAHVELGIKHGQDDTVG